MVFSHGLGRHAAVLTSSVKATPLGLFLQLYLKVELWIRLKVCCIIVRIIFFTLQRHTPHFNQSSATFMRTAFTTSHNAKEYCGELQRVKSTLPHSSLLKATIMPLRHFSQRIISVQCSIRGEMADASTAAQTGVWTGGSYLDSLHLCAFKSMPCKEPVIQKNLPIAQGSCCDTQTA